jgi:hypothetical protein
MSNQTKAMVIAESPSTLVAIPATAAHRPIVEISLPRLKAQLQHADFLIVSPSPEAFTHLADEHTRVAPDNEFSVLTKSALTALLAPEKREVAGWYYQQFLKYSIVAQSKFDKVLILDADTVVLRNINTGPCEFFTSKERHRPYFEHFESLFDARPPLKSSAITNFMWFKPQALCEMLSEIENRHHKLWWQAIIDIANPIAHRGAFSEYETYANWCALRKALYKEVPIHIFRRGDLLCKGESGYQLVVNKLLNSRFDSVAFEFNHRQGFIRKLGAQIILKFGFRDW